MRNYSKGPFELGEMAAVFVGLCNAIKEECPSDFKEMASNPKLANAINILSVKYKSPLSATGDLGRTSIALQSLIETLIKDGVVDKATIEVHVHGELSKLTPSPFVDYFTGVSKI